MNSLRDLVWFRCFPEKFQHGMAKRPYPLPSCGKMAEWICRKTQIHHGRSSQRKPPDVKELSLRRRWLFAIYESMPGSQIIERGGKNQVYSRGTAQFHWGVSPRDKWVLFDVKSDPGCRKDLSMKNLNFSVIYLLHTRNGGMKYILKCLKKGETSEILIKESGHRKEIKNGKKRKTLFPDKLFTFPTQISKPWGFSVPLRTKFFRLRLRASAWS